MNIAKPRTGALVRGALLVLLPLSLVFLCCGCQVIGAVAHAIPQTKKAQYAGLANQSVGVMVWADRAVKIDWPSIQLDLASKVQDRLRQSTADELKGTTWPVLPASIVKYQRNYPNTDSLPITEVAPKLGVSRLIYLEVQSLSTRSETAFQLFRGNAAVTLKVVEVSGTQAKIGYEESGIRYIFPPKSAPEGIQNASDPLIYQGTITGLAQQIADRLTTHQVE